MSAGSIRTPDQRLRVFISSTLEELAEERRAVRAAVEQMRLAAVMFELGARPHPPRALYRSYLEQSDVFVGIYWQRYGWVAPGMEISGLEDELVLAAGMPRLIYVKQPAPDLEPRLADLLERLDVEGATTYKPFRDAEELQRLVVDDLAIMLTERFDSTRGAKPSGVALGNLPAQTSGFVGREVVLAQLDELLEAGVRLLTLTGAGGTGKTRLALRLAADRLDRFEDGVFFVDLSAEREPEGVFTAIARTLAVGALGDAPAIDALARELRGARLMLLLDNCEHVVDAARDLDALLQQCPDLMILATSQVALKVRGEQLFPVPPLSLPHGDERGASVPAALESEAVRLFSERARAVSPGFEVTERNVGGVVDICTRLDGLPLAIELAAAHVNLFSVDELRARLDERLDILQGKAPDLPERQRTLRSAIEWSRELLTPSESRMLALFAVFSGARLRDVDGSAARVPALRDLDVVEELGSLLDKSLVRSTHGADGQPRFSMLQTIRAYALEQLDADPALSGAVRRAHAEQYTERAGELQDARDIDDRSAVLARLDDELGNLRAAWSYWVQQRDVARLDELLESLWAYYDARGDYRATTELGADLLEVLATQPESPERTRDEVALQMSLARALIAIEGFGADAEQRIVAALAQSGGTGTDLRRFPALRCLASLQIMRTDFESSAAVADELLAIAERERDPSLLSEAHLVTGVNCLQLAGLGDALEHVSRSVDYEDESTSGFVRFRVGPHPKVASNTVKALLLWLTGKPDSAVSQQARTLEIATELGHPYSTCYALFHAGLLDLWRQDLDALGARADELLALADAHDYPIWRALGLVLRGTVLVGGGESDAGLADLDQGFTLYQGLSTPPVFWPALLGIRAATCARAGRAGDALTFIEAAEHAMRGNDPVSGDVPIVRGDLLLALDPPDAAQAELLFERAAAFAAERGARMTELQALTRLANLRRGTPREPEARECLRRLLDTFTEGFATPQLVAARTALES
jgi:predicted ATPase